MLEDTRLVIGVKARDSSEGLLGYASGSGFDGSGVTIAEKFFKALATYQNWA
jgi:hypothetical protein